MTTPTSPLPWTVEPNRARIEIHTAHDKSIALCGKIADAEYIVQACNAFPALYAALERLLEHTVGATTDYDATSVARAALALARGEKGERK